ncbi:MAG: PD-(D/E)XK nuclease family protein [Anaerolineales bacterium]|nr:PD-(D/E)XK nuclease family protein [Anaerolineales bacterium]
MVSDRQALEALIVDNPELERLEELLAQFNIFEAVGAVRHEVRHSDFLAFLLDPNQSHGLADEFLTRFIRKAMQAADNVHLPISPLDLAIWHLDTTQVRREWQNIDILLLNDAHEFAVIIENKIDSTEHSDQLQRYRQTVGQHRPGWKLLAIYLTPDGAAPSDDIYLRLDYGSVAELVENVVSSRASSLGQDLRVLMTHYSQMLRRHIVNESEIAQLCQRIYQKHQRALDLIYEYRPDLQGTLREILEQLVKSTPTLELDQCSKSAIRFVPTAWNAPELHSGSGWTRTGRILLFEFKNAPDRLKLYLIIGPGPLETRQRLFEMAIQHSPPFRSAYRALNAKWNTVFDRAFLGPKAYEDADGEKLEADIKKEWTKFIENDLPAINNVLSAQGWLSRPSESTT